MEAKKTNGRQNDFTFLHCDDKASFSSALDSIRSLLRSKITLCCLPAITRTSCWYLKGFVESTFWRVSKDRFEIFGVANSCTYSYITVGTVLVQLWSLSHKSLLKFKHKVWRSRKWYYCKQIRCSGKSEDKCRLIPWIPLSFVRHATCWMPVSVAAADLNISF